MENDYIKRSDAIKTICGDCEYYSTNDCEDCRLDRLTKIPAADVRPVVRAKWEDETGFIFNDLAQRVYCPNCKSYAYFYPHNYEKLLPQLWLSDEWREQGAEGGA